MKWLPTNVSSRQPKGGFPGNSVVNNPPANVGRRHRFDPCVGKIPLRRKWQPTPVFLPAESHGQRSLVSYSPWCCEESDTTEQHSTGNWKGLMPDHRTEGSPLFLRWFIHFNKYFLSHCTLGIMLSTSKLTKQILIFMKLTFSWRDNKLVYVIKHVMLRGKICRKIRHDIADRNTIRQLPFKAGNSLASQWLAPQDFRN